MSPFTIYYLEQNLVGISAVMLVVCCRSGIHTTRRGTIIGLRKRDAIRKIGSLTWRIATPSEEDLATATGSMHENLVKFSNWCRQWARCHLLPWPTKYC